MPSTETDRLTPRRPLRLWPAAVLGVLLFLTWLVLPRLVANTQLYAVLGAGLGALAVLVWWIFFSRAPWAERLSALVAMIVGIVVTPYFLHRSVAEGNVGYQFYIWAIPTLAVALAAWALGARKLAGLPRRVTMVASLLLACGIWTLVRNDGLNSDGVAQFSWRWAQTPEARLLSTADEPGVPVATAAAPARADWPGFRGPGRDAVLPAVRIETDWSQSPPTELWRRPIGPGTSSFAVGGGLLYTQEQRGEDEVVAAYDLATGEPVWIHRDEARFDDPYVGVGPRATPTLAGGRIYALGATGILNALDARTGRVVWSRDAAADAGAKPPIWGFVSSPLALGDDVVVYTTALAAYDAATGEPRWSGAPSGGTYGSPQLTTVDGVAQIVLQRNAGATGFAPADGTLLWEHPWKGIGILQPAVTADGDLLVSMINEGAMPMGLRRIAVAHGPDGWTVEERWASERLKPSFSSLVVHRNHAFGFDGSLLACVDVADGERAWKGGRYGHGTLLLLPDQDVLLVLSEKGELALVEATPDRFSELGRVPAIEGRTWNQPVLAGDVLLVRNGEEMAAFRLALAGGPG